MRAIGTEREKVFRLLQHIRGLSASPEAILTSCPCVIAANISAIATKKLKVYLEQAGATVAIRQYHPSAPKSLPASFPSDTPPHAIPRPVVSVTGNDQPMPTKQAVPIPDGAAQISPLHRQSSNSPASAISLKRSVGELTKALQNGDWTIREAALLELSLTPSNGVVQHIIKALRDDVWHVRCTALDVLSKIGSASALKDMVKCLSDDVWHVRYCAVGALRGMESNRTIKPLVFALHDENWQIRQRVTQVLGELRSQRALPALVATLQDEVWQVRESAVWALGQLRSEKSIKALSRALIDPNWHVRSMAVSALWQIGSEQAFEPLLHALHDDDWMVHWKAAYALGKIATPAILPILTRLEQQKNAFLQSISRDILKTLDIVTIPQAQTPIRLEYRSEDTFANMCYIAPGHFIMGRENGSPNASPEQSVYLDGFFIDMHEVTNAQYKRFDPNHSYPDGMEAFPVVNITWDEANAYARWIGKRLPTEAEWEKASRGTDGRTFPWGSEFDHTRCNTQESGVHHLTPVSQYPSGISPFGVYDMTGNVLEWTADRYKPYAWSQHQSPDYDEDFIVLRGGSWIHPEYQSTCTTRLYAPADNRSNFIGFRCAKDFTS
ncbi:hypothetical protein U14_01098 [Candidatus Moduliflexus flocculans]|uniref:Sulfatase-modifying factor enzyme-like domain-containing protein n=1 Tax=Candidatus Moduliflexus flocculans TaxID=1499966 RepID=A0A0S6VRN7_9BACT|nr:hypothetical protein U14_01098 [Candidatus Moduliflexus flocculans]